jgi:hypothetical protein
MTYSISLEATMKRVRMNDSEEAGDLVTIHLTALFQRIEVLSRFRQWSIHHPSLHSGTGICRTTRTVTRIQPAILSSQEPMVWRLCMSTEVAHEKIKTPTTLFVTVVGDQAAPESRTNYTDTGRKVDGVFCAYFRAPSNG